MIQEALGRDGNSLPALLYGAQLAFDKKDLDRAERLAAQASAADRDSPLALYLIGRVREAKGRPNEASKEYERALKMRPTFMPAVMRLGEIAERNGDKLTSRDAFRKVYAAQPDLIEARAALLRIGE